MKRIIYKYSVNNTHPIELSVDSKFLFFAVQDNVHTAWFQVGIHPTLTKRFFKVFGTGEELPHGATHLGTTIEGQYVWHLYEMYE